MNTEIAAYKSTEAVIADLASRYKDVVFAVATADGMMQAKAAYKDINTHNITLEKARTAEKEASLAYGRFVDSEARRIADKLDALRLPIKQQIETETKRAEREREERIRAEAARIEAEQRAAREAQEKKLAEERAALAKERAKLEADQREARQRIEAAENQARAEREEADRKARAERAKEEERLRAERAVIEKAKREQEEKERAERMAKEQAERTLRLAEEAKRRAIQKEINDKTDARGMLATFVQRYGHISEFSEVVKAIKEYQDHEVEL